MALYIKELENDMTRHNLAIFMFKISLKVEVKVMQCNTCSCNRNWIKWIKIQGVSM